MLTARLKARCPSAAPVRVGMVRGRVLRWHKVSSDGSGKGNLPAGRQQDVAYGVIFEIEVSERAALDEAEGLGRGYDAVEIVVDGDTGPVECLAYLASDIDDHRQPYDWYRRLALAGALEHGLPEFYVAQIAVVTTKVDRKPRRKSRLEAERLLTDFLNQRPEHKHRLTGVHDDQALA